MKTFRGSRSEEFLLNAFPRGLAIFLGGFAILNLLGALLVPGFDTNLWWIDLRGIPSAIATPALLMAALVLTVFGVCPPRSLVGRCTAALCASGLGLVALVNSIQFYFLMARGTIRAGLPIPLTLFVSAGLVLIAGAALYGSAPGWNARHLRHSLAVVLACLAIFPLAQMFCFGKTDYRRPADVAVVLGARVYADGRLSNALADRVRTACQLYSQGWTRKLVFSGGPGDGTVSEPEAMARVAIQLGVKPEDILLDNSGLNTQATVRNTEAIFERLHASRILVVSHDYHLPRVKLAYQRAGREVYTVPARESHFMKLMPYYMLREVAALWAYYARPLANLQ
jgi:vancomycin permeability regulator SanA